MKFLALCLVLATIAFSAYSYSIDLPYISFGEKKAGGNDENKKVNMNDMINKKADARPQIDLSKPMTLRQCIDIALKESPTMKVARISLDQEELNVQDAKSNYLPSINVSGRYMFSEDIDFGWEKENYDSSLDASYTIWDHGQRKSALAQAKARKSAEYSRYKRTSQSLIFNVIRAYYAYWRQKKLYPLMSNCSKYPSRTLRE